MFSCCVYPLWWLWRLAFDEKDVFDVLKDQQIPIGSFLGSYETANGEGGPGVLLNKYYLTNNNVLVRIDKGKDGQLIPTALGKI